MKTDTASILSILVNCSSTVPPKQTPTYEALPNFLPASARLVLSPAGYRDATLHLRARLQWTISDYRKFICLSYGVKAESNNHLQFYICIQILESVL